MRILLYKFEGFIFGLLLAIAASGVGIGVIEHLQYKELIRSLRPTPTRYKDYSSYMDMFKQEDKYN